jgi:hypothetical protein
MSDPQKKALEDAMKNVVAHLRVTKVVCTRSVKGRQGDNYVGFSAAWDSTQDDAGGAADLSGAQGEKDTRLAAKQGMTLGEARMAALVLGMQADLSAHDHAMAGCNLPPDQHSGATQAIKHNYMKLMADRLAKSEPTQAPVTEGQDG